MLIFAVAVTATVVIVAALDSASDSSSNMGVGEGVCPAMPSMDEARTLLDTAAVALLEPLRKEVSER